VHLFGRGCLPAYFDGGGSFLNRLSRVSSKKKPSPLPPPPPPLPPTRLSCVPDILSLSLSFLPSVLLSCFPSFRPSFRPSALLGVPGPFNDGRPLTMPTCSATAFELAVYLIVRAESFYKKTFFTCQCVTTLGVVLVPLFMTNTSSYGAARKVCYDWTFALNNVTNFDVDAKYYNPEWDMKDTAIYHLSPMHLFNCISIVVSLFGFWVWFFFSPHMSDVTRALDRTCTKPNCISVWYPKTQTLFLMLPPSACLMTSFVLLYSRQLFCPSVAGEPPCCCRSVKRCLRTINNSTNGSSIDQRTHDVRAVRDRNELLGTSLPSRKSARHAQTVRQSWTALPHFISTPLLATHTHIYIYIYIFFFMC
jgi:hypothetical protein